MDSRARGDAFVAAKTDPRSECLEWIRAQEDARIRTRRKARAKLFSKRHKERKRLRRLESRSKREVPGVHDGTGIHLSRVRNDDHVTLRTYGVTSAMGVFAAVALTRDGVQRLHQRLGNILAQWSEK